MAQKFNPKKTLEYELKVGNYLILDDKRNFLYPNDLFEIAYAGILSKDTFSIILSNNGSTGTNFFYPIPKKEIDIYEKRFEILEVNPEKIKLKYLGEK